MMRAVHLTAFACCCILLNSCGRKEPVEVPVLPPYEGEMSSPTEQPGTPAIPDEIPLDKQTWIDEVTIGHKLNPDGSVESTNSRNIFAPGQPVRLALVVGDAPLYTPVKVLWFGPLDIKMGEDSKYISPGRRYLHFTALDTANWEMGEYRAEIWVGDEKVEERHFDIGIASETDR